nr:hypothetical protein BAU18_02615 [Enterococcus diestrammenae]
MRYQCFAVLKYQVYCYILFVFFFTRGEKDEISVKNFFCEFFAKVFLSESNGIIDNIGGN